MHALVCWICLPRRHKPKRSRRTTDDPPSPQAPTGTAAWKNVDAGNLKAVAGTIMSEIIAAAAAGNQDTRPPAPAFDPDADVADPLGLGQVNFNDLSLERGAAPSGAQSVVGGAAACAGSASRVAWAVSLLRTVCLAAVAALHMRR